MLLNLLDSLSLPCYYKYQIMYNSFSSSKTFISLLASICTYLFLFSTPLSAQIETKMLSPKKMQKDLEYLLDNLEGHPDPYTKISEEDFMAIVEEVKENISVELDEIDYYKNLARIVASIHDGHSSVYFPKDWLKNVRKDHGAFPYEVFLSNEGNLYLIKSFIEEQVPIGSEILEINGMKTSDFIDEVSLYLSFETIPFRNDRITNSFENLLYLVFKKTDQLTFKTKYLKEEEFTVTNMPYKEWKAKQKDDQEYHEQKIARGEPYDFKIIEPGIAKIDIFSFSVASQDKYKFFLSKTFKEIKKENVHSLIIDIRGNYGGYPKVSSLLFHYIHEGYFKTMAQSSMKISHAYRRSFTDRYPALKNSNYIFPAKQHFVDLQEVLRGKHGTFVDEAEFFNESPETKENEFYGDCYLLIDRKSYSASSSFASSFQCYSMGYIIGETTGGTKIFRANPFARILGSTGFRVRVSSTKLYTACYDQEDQGVTPNFQVVPSMVDRINNIDKQLQTAIHLIKQVQAKREAELNKGN